MSNFKLLVRTREKFESPVVDIISIASGIAHIYEWVRGKFKGFIEKTECYQNLFRFLDNCDFFIGKRYPQKKKDPWSYYDIIAIKEIIDSLPGIFDKPKIKKIKDNEKIEFKDNLCSIGGPIPNKFTRLIFGLEMDETKKSIIKYYGEKLEFFDSVPNLKYRFNLEIGGRCASLDELKSLYPEPNEPNWTIIGGGEEFIPEFREGRYVRDYGMLIKVKHPIKEARRLGKRVLVIAGCHGVGTYGSASLLKKDGILKEIWEKVGDSDFQCLVMVDSVGKRGDEKIIRVELLDIVRV